MIPDGHIEDIEKVKHKSLNSMKSHVIMAPRIAVMISAEVNNSSEISAVFDCGAALGICTNAHSNIFCHKMNWCH